MPSRLGQHRLYALHYVSLSACTPSTSDAHEVLPVVSAADDVECSARATADRRFAQVQVRFEV